MALSMFDKNHHIPQQKLKVISRPVMFVAL
jgi:hypothetical protein